MLWSSFGSFYFSQIISECQSGCVCMESREVAEPIKLSSLYDDVPLLNFVCCVQVVIFLCLFAVVKHLQHMHRLF